MPPLISIILPNLNTDLKFLNPRVQSILNQSFINWECIVIDGFSENGSWEFLRDEVRNDSRFKLYQKPKLGIYNAWNEGIKLALGEYIYIATSDDTMHNDLLKIMASALDEHTSCDIAHCCLTIIDEQGLPIANLNWDHFPQARYFGDLIHQKHIRYAPHDGILHAFVKTVYQSVTQLLIRKKVFEEFGYFLENSRSIADYEWGMRVSSVKNTFHIPQYLATWRFHPGQATTADIQSNPKTYEKLIEWVSFNFNKTKKKYSNNTSAYLMRDLTRVYRQNRYYFLMQQLKEKSPFFYKWYRRIFRPPLRYTDGVEEARQYFKEQALQHLIKII